MRPAALAATAVAALLLAGCGGRGSGTPAGRSSAQPVPQLQSIGELRSAFNAHSDVPRLVVLIAPT
jgi:hypothetical protein